MAFWSDQSTVYTARIYEDGQLGDHTGIADATQVRQLRIAPSPASGPVSALVPAGLVVRTARAVDAQGRATSLPILSYSGERVQLECPPH